MKHFVVVGSGIAGLTAALDLSRRYRVTLVTKGDLSESNTRFAQGGIAAALFPDDTVAEHVEDTLIAGAGLCNRRAVEVLCAEGPDRVRELIALGVAFDRHNGELARGLEGAHSHPRVLHAGGDATGLAIETALAAAIRESGVEVLEHTFAADLVLEPGADSPRVTGLEVILPTGEHRHLRADAVLLACGGAGQLYPYTTNPPVATGDGVAMALRAGAELADLEFYQFHPTALAVPGNFLVSEAVRGDGATLLDRDGRRFMLELHPQAELAPRDVVARGIARQMERQGGVPVLLDATALGREFLANRFPTIDAACRRAGLDWATTPVPVTPAAHYWMGGVRTDIWGRTSVPGLFAIGEVACTGVHGANRLASNSLLESLVFASRAARLLLDSPDVTGEAWPRLPPVQTIRPDDLPRSSGAATVPLTRSALQQLMWRSAGIERTAAGLAGALAQTEEWVAAAHSPGSTLDRETSNLLQLARALVSAALAREESRGAHFREDFPESSAAFQHQIAVVRAGSEAAARLGSPELLDAALRT